MAESNTLVSPLRLFCVSTALILLLQLGVFSVVADDDSGSCNEDLTSFLPPPYSYTSRFTCRPIWNTFVLRFSQSEDHELTIVLSGVYNTGWVGVGFSKDGMMVGSSAMAGWIGKEGRANVKQYSLQGLTVQEVIPDKGELNVTKVPTVVVLHGSTIYLAFQLKFAARINTQSILLAYGSETPIRNQLSMHDDKTTISFDFNAGSLTSATQNQNNGDLKRNHGILGIIGWGVLLPTGAIIARYFKQWDPQWYYLHTVIQFVGFIIGLVAVVTGKILYDRLNVNVPAHRGIGIFVLVLSTLQVMAFFLRPNKDFKIRKYWNWYHHGVGRLALFLGALNIVLGILIGGAGIFWMIGYGILLAVVLVTVIVLESYLQMRVSQKTFGPPAFQMNPI